MGAMGVFRCIWRSIFLTVYVSIHKLKVLFVIPACACEHKCNSQWVHGHGGRLGSKENRPAPCHGPTAAAQDRRLPPPGPGAHSPADQSVSTDVRLARPHLVASDPPRANGATESDNIRGRRRLARRRRRPPGGNMSVPPRRSGSWPRRSVPPPRPV